MNINDKSIEELENDYWVDLDFDSYVVKKSQMARKKPISKLSDEEIRLLIGQKIGLHYLIPIALSIIEPNPLIEITFFEGDLLSQLFSLSLDDWKDNKEDLKQFQEIIIKNFSLIESCNEIPKEMIEKYLNY
ncbi:MAG: contact-dependent growth inhibition system immunity protein [Oscillospiraceae bacterium]